MTVHLSGGDLARVYAASLGVSGNNPHALQDAADAVDHFLETVERVSGSKPHIGDPFVWEREPDRLPGLGIRREE